MLFCSVCRLRFVGGGTGLYIGATWRTSLLIAIKDIKQATSNQTMQNLGFQFQVGISFLFPLFL
jgi:hypothetical protein